MKRFTAVAVLLVVAATAANAQAPAAKKPMDHSQMKSSAAANAAVTGISFPYTVGKMYLTATAAQVPAEKFSYQPTPAVRTLGAIIGHVADANWMFCGIAEGKPAPQDEGNTNEKLGGDKAAVGAALKKAFDYCDAVTAKLTDADLARPVTLFGQNTNVAGVLALNAAHNMEHYGNLVTYMRMNNIVPPSSQPQNQ